jgi:hypothetical protein
MDTATKYVTVDTNLYEDSEVIDIGKGLPYIHLYPTAITEQEVGKKVVLGYQLATPVLGSMHGDATFEPNRAIPSIFTIGVSVIGGTEVIADEGKGDELVREILKITTHGSAQYPRDINSSEKGIRNHINDALILQAHCNRRHHIFISNDISFIGKAPADPKRIALEQLCMTQIMSGSEFKKEYGAHLGRAI